MWQILFDHARRQAASKRGGNAVTLVVDEASAASQQKSLDLLALDDAMKRVASLDPRQCQILELRCLAAFPLRKPRKL
jgi:hypothetical protein